MTSLLWIWELHTHLLTYVSVHTLTRPPAPRPTLGIRCPFRESWGLSQRLCVHAWACSLAVRRGKMPSCMVQTPKLLSVCTHVFVCVRVCVRESERESVRMSVTDWHVGLALCDSFPNYSTELCSFFLKISFPAISALFRCSQWKRNGADGADGGSDVWHH